MKNDYEKMFEGIAGAFTNGMHEKALEHAHRVTAVNAGAPIKAPDAVLDKRRFMAADAIRVILEGGSPHSLLEEYELPDARELLQKTPQGNFIFHIAGIQALQKVLAFTGIERPEDVHDLRTVDPRFYASERWRMKIDAGDPNLRALSFQPAQMLVGTLASVHAHAEPRYQIVPYPHIEETDGRTRITSKSLLLVKEAALADIRRVCVGII